MGERGDAFDASYEELFDADATMPSIFSSGMPRLNSGS
jgi:hypothetical protein